MAGRCPRPATAAAPQGGRGGGGGRRRQLSRCEGARPGQRHPRVPLCDSARFRARVLAGRPGPACACAVPRVRARPTAAGRVEEGQGWLARLRGPECARGDEPGPGSGTAAGSPGSSGQAPPRAARGPRFWLCAGRRKPEGPEHAFGPSFRLSGTAPAPSGAWLLGAVAGGSQRSVSPRRNSRATCLCFFSALRERTDGVLQKESSRVRL